MTGEQKRSIEKQVQQQDGFPTSRWMEHSSAERTNLAIYNLVDTENVRARAITEAVDEMHIDRAFERSKADSPLKIINEILRTSNISISLSIRESDQVTASKQGSTPYSIAELSDGERNAILIAVNILTAKPKSLLLIDEPERHLHRSIISPLLRALLEKRPDCAFVISTHELLLPLESPSSKTLLVRNCVYTGPSPSAWNCDILPPDLEIGDDIKTAILGARRTLVFVEGTDCSLDIPLYSLIFPGASVIPKATCRDVEHTVSSIRDASGLHYLRAFGIVDKDDRSPDDTERLKAKGTYTLGVRCVESIYYHPEIQRRIAERQIKLIGGDAATLLADAKRAALKSISTHITRLGERIAEKTVRNAFFANLPNRSTIAQRAPIQFSFDVSTTVQSACEELRRAINADDFASIVERYPIRETPALNDISKCLGFQGRHQYEMAVRKLLTDDTGALQFTRSLFGGLETEIVNTGG